MSLGSRSSYGVNFSRRPRPLLRGLYYFGALKSDDADGDFAVQAAKGDEAAFNALVKRHKPWLNRWIIGHVKHPEDAHDILQEVFLAVWRNLSHYDPRRPFKDWLSYIALNKCRDAARRAIVRRRASAKLPAITVTMATPETAMLRDQALERLERAIDKLPLTRKDALLLTVLGDHSQSEAAQRLGATAKAIETRLHHARQQLAGLVKASDLADLIDKS